MPNSSVKPSKDFSPAPHLKNQLSSVRELKQALAAKVLPQIETNISTRFAFGMAAAPLARAAEPPPSVALGVAPADNGDGFKLAVRVQKRTFQGSKEVELITKQAKGMVDIRYVGRVSRRDAMVSRSAAAALDRLLDRAFKVTAGTLVPPSRRRRRHLVCR